MKTLSIATSGSWECVALLSEKKVLKEHSWEGNYDESEKLLPIIEKLLKKANLSFKDLDQIVVARGPGPFSAVRIGVTVANTLSHCLGVPLYEVDAQTLWRVRAPAIDAVLLLHAGGTFVARYGKGIPHDIVTIGDAINLPAIFSKKPLVFYGDITENEMREFAKGRKKNWTFVDERKLISIGEAFLALVPSRWKRQTIVTPRYWKPPHITKPTHVS